MDCSAGRAVSVYGALAQRRLEPVKHCIDGDAAKRDKEPNGPDPARQTAMARKVFAPGAPDDDDDKGGIEGGENDVRDEDGKV